MKVINLFGSPGTGKSTTAAGLFFLMKTAGLSVELISEYAKQMVWDERSRMFQDQIYLTAKQNHKQDMLRGKVDYCITDSPLLLGLHYAAPDYYPSYRVLLKEIWNSYENINFFLTRVKPYVAVGRNQNEEESNRISLGIVDMLNHYRVDLVKLDITSPCEGEDVGATPAVATIFGSVT
jgi:tRNA uridine 5-carbamoylmethylation protein Kti12